MGVMSGPMVARVLLSLCTPAAIHLREVDGGEDDLVEVRGVSSGEFIIT